MDIEPIGVLLVVVGIATIIGGGLLWYLQPPCKHKWETLSKETTESMAEQSCRLHGSAPTPRNVPQVQEIYGRKNIRVMSYTHCGKLKRFVEEV